MVIVARRVLWAGLTSFYGGYGVEATQELVELLSRVRFPLAALPKISSK